MDTKTRDLFGFDTQGENYDIYRPRYPVELIQDIKNFCGKKENYLDVASGTGKMFFELYKDFSQNEVINDKSSKQLEVIRQKLRSVDHTAKIEILECDFFDIPKHLTSKDLKFDLVTFASAFHWFEPIKALEYTVKELLDPEGAIAVLGTVVTKGLEYNYQSEDAAFSKQCQTRFDEFTEAISPYFESYRDILLNGYSTVDFEKYFEVVQRTSLTVTKEMSIEEVKKYFGTVSAYNVYVEKNKGKESFKDPLDKLYDGIREDLAAYAEKTKGELKEKPVLLIQPYYLVLAKKYIPL